MAFSSLPASADFMCRQADSRAGVAQSGSLVGTRVSHHHAVSAFSPCRIRFQIASLMTGVDRRSSSSLVPPQTFMSTWSAQIADRYRCRLSPVIADWFDSGQWKLAGSDEFRDPVSPVALLAPSPDVIWPALMGCDLIPLLGNLAGDWLCARIDQDDLMSEVVHWYHGGGDWIPWGSDLAQAIVFDATVDRMPAAQHRHAVPAENPRPVADQHERRQNPQLRWALSHVPSTVAQLVDESVLGEEISQAMIDCQVAEVAVRCERVVASLAHGHRERLASLVGSDGAHDRVELAQWAFDLDMMPKPIRVRLQQQAGHAESQDWQSAAHHCRHVCRIAPDLAWAWEIAGYAAERKGELTSAMEAYRHAATCSVFTDQSIRLGTHWLADESAKFAVARMQRISPDEIAGSTYYQLLCQRDTRRRRLESTNYWIEQASRFADVAATDDENTRHNREAHRCYVAAAWDLGAEPISTYAGLLERIAETAQRSGQHSRSEVARTHRRCLQARYGL